ncbi:transposable element Tc1 transposase [Trichonephila clavipes]|nr:transposable element Tc1 transposase [Trichonephila clavipes]
MTAFPYAKNAEYQSFAHPLNDGASRTVSKWIVRRSLHRMGFGSYRPMRVPLLNARNWAARFAWEREHRDWSDEDWKRIFYSNSSTSYKSWMATGWLDEYSSDFPFRNWPLRSPDLNRIDHLWDVLEQGVKDHHTKPMNLTELGTAVSIIWQVIPVERF